MKDYLRAVKLAAGVGLLLASVALGASNKDMQATTPQEPKEKTQVIVSGDADLAVPQKVQAKQVIVTSDGDSMRIQVLDPDQQSENPPVLGQATPQQDIHRMDKALWLSAPGSLTLSGTIETPEYWIGVRCHGPVPELLRGHLNLEKDQGLVVIEVVDGSPAAKAGLKPNDILLRAGEQPLGNVLDLVKAVEEAKEQPLAIDLIRNGKKEQIQVTPEGNPQLKMKKASPGGEPPYGELDRINAWFERNHPRPGGKPGMRMLFMHPGTILPADALVHPALPGGMSITIMKQGDEPTRITVRRGKDVWKVSEKELDKLPKDIRPSVERMLQGVVSMPDMLIPRMPSPGELRPGADVPVPEWFDQRMDQMNRSIERLQEMIERKHDRKGPEEEK